jgi:hypothetical protein
MAAPSKAVSFSEVSVKVSEKKTKKFSSGTIGPAAARALNASAIYKIEEGDIIPLKPKVINVQAKTMDRSSNQSPAPKEDK